jgi:hypothetical protein
MLEGRIYRAGFAVVVLAVLVLGFSFRNQQSPLSATLAPDAFNGQNAYSTTNTLANQYPDRSPGSVDDRDLAAGIAQSFRDLRYTVNTDTYTAQTADGPRTLENVIGTRPGVQTGSIVVVASRDARGSPATASLSGAGTELELARDLAGETLNHTVVLASISGTQGMAGVFRLASTLNGPIDAVIVLGDLASGHVRQPVIVPWSNSPTVAPTVLRNTLDNELSQQAALVSGGTSLFGQLAHLAFPITLSPQGAFNANGIPSVYLSLAGERGAAPDTPLGSEEEINTVGRAVLASISALDGGAQVPAPSAYVLFSGMVVPGWAMSLFVLSLLVPVLLASIDGLARARRHGQVIWRWLVVAVVAAAPFAVAALVVLAARLFGAIPVAPPAAVPAGAIPIHFGGAAVIVLAALGAIGTFFALRRATLRFAIRVGSSRRSASEQHEGVVAALLVLMCAVTFALWVTNPFMAALAIPALHLWLLAVNPDIRLRVPLRALLLALGLVPVGLIVAYYASTLGLGPTQLVWTAVLLLAGHAVSLVSVLEWSLFLGCAVMAGAVVLLEARQPKPEQVPVTVRGPITYAGPGSLGGTKSAIRR